MKLIALRTWIYCTGCP